MWKSNWKRNFFLYTNGLENLLTQSAHSTIVFKTINWITVKPTAVEKPRPCEPNPCGTNAQCKEQNGAINCVCPTDYTGDPYTSCRPECLINTDCPRDKSCSRNRCIDPCPGTCGANADCRVVNHIPVCACKESFTGDPYGSCRPIPVIRMSNWDFKKMRVKKMTISLILAKPTSPSVIKTPCDPHPCGPNSNCKAVDNSAVCSCQPGYLGIPPQCRPECVSSSECSSSFACINLKCQDPCKDTCGPSATCKAVNHIPVCSCPTGLIGDPLTGCRSPPSKTSTRPN